MSEIDNLLNELRKMKAEERQRVLNTLDTWQKIGAGDFEGLGFKTKEEMQSWIADNPYSNLI